MYNQIHFNGFSRGRVNDVYSINEFSGHADWETEQYAFSLVTHSQNLLVAAGTGGSEELLIAMYAVHLAPLLHKSTVCQGGVAVRTVEFLGVPCHAHGHEKRAPVGKKQRTRKITQP